MTWSVDDLIDEALDYLRAYPKADREQVRRHLEEVVTGQDDGRRAGQTILFGPLIMVVGELIRGLFGLSQQQKIDAAVREVFRKKQKKRR